MIAQQSSAVAIVPQGHPKIAQHFSAGYHGVKIISPEGTAEFGQTIANNTDRVRRCRQARCSRAASAIFHWVSVSRPVKPSQACFEKNIFPIAVIFAYESTNPEIHSSNHRFRSLMVGYGRLRTDSPLKGVLLGRAQCFFHPHPKLSQPIPAVFGKKRLFKIRVHLLAAPKRGEGGCSSVAKFLQKTLCPYVLML